MNPDGYFASAGHCVEYDPAIEQPIIAQAAEWSFQNEAWPEGWTLDMAKTYAARFWKVRSAESPGRTRPDRHVDAAYGVDVGGLPIGRALPARLLGYRSFTKGDVALLKIEAENVPVLKLATGSAVDVGTEVVAVGYPASVNLVTDVTFEASFKDGSVSSHKTTGGGLVGAYEISAPVSKGMSGGPTVDLQGRVIGVNSFYPRDETQPFNFVSPVAEVAQLMRDKGVENRLGRTNSLYLAGIRAYYAGDREAALEKLDAVLGQVREHEFAQEFRAKALRLPKESAESGFPIALLVIGLGGVAGLAGAVAFGLSRRGGPSAPAHAPQASGPRPPRPPAPRQASPRLTPVMPNGGGRDPCGELIVIDGPLAGERIELRSDLVLGRGPVDVMIDDAEISRRHAAIRARDGRVEITDLDSSNGTWVDGTPIDGPRLLVDGDVIGLGDTRIEVRTPAHGPQAQATVMRAAPAR